jgi:hypothetical protein
MASVTTFYSDPPTVARVVRDGDSIASAVWNATLGKWVDSPATYARTLGIGGDGLSVITRDQARAIVEEVKR